MSVNGHLNGLKMQDEGIVLNGNGVEAVVQVENGAYVNGKESAKLRKSGLLGNGNSIQNGNGYAQPAVKTEEDAVMDGIEDIKISDEMDIDDDGENKAGITNGGGGSKRLDTLKKSVSPKGLHSVEGTMKIGTTSENGSVSLSTGFVVWF